MKKFCIVFLVLTILLATAALFAAPAAGAAQPAAYLRMHVRANSDSAADQAVKYAVKDALVAYLIPVAAECTTKAAATEAVEARLAALEEVADGVLAKAGFAYTAKASLREEAFPARVYDGVTLEAGVYDALIVELGAGAGQNWWCVVYPPLCFAGEAGGGQVRYRSRLLEIIAEFFAG